MWWHMTAEAMRPVKRVRGSGREIIEFMGDSVDEFSKKGIDYLNLSIYIIHIIYIIIISNFVAWQGDSDLEKLRIKMLKV